jgi:hypothetical protein
MDCVDTGQKTIRITGRDDMPTKKTLSLKHDDIRKIINNQSDLAREEVLKEKRKKLKKNPKKLKEDLKKPISVLQQAYKTEADIHKRRKGKSLMRLIKETYELCKEFATLESPIEVYIFTAAVWASGVLAGHILL